MSSKAWVLSTPPALFLLVAKPTSQPPYLFPCQALVSYVQISKGVVTLLMPHPKSASATLPALGSYVDVISAAVKKATSTKGGTVTMEGWHARFMLERHGLKVKYFTVLYSDNMLSLTIVHALS